jgi:hypothetical protein
MKKIVFTSAATRQWIKLSVDVRRRLDKRLSEFARAGREMSNVFTVATECDCVSAIGE